MFQSRTDCFCCGSQVGIWLSCIAVCGTRYWDCARGIGMLGQCVSTAVAAGSQDNQSGLMGRSSFAMRAPPSLQSSNHEAKGWACTISLIAFMTKPLPLPGIRITQPWGTLPIPGSSQLYSLSPAHKSGIEMHHVHQCQTRDAVDQLQSLCSCFKDWRYLCINAGQLMLAWPSHGHYVARHHA